MSSREFRTAYGHLVSIFSRTSASKTWPARINCENVISYGVMVTVADPIMSDGGRLEKKGVEPDFKNLPNAEDLSARSDPALAQALKFAGQSVDAQAAGALLLRQ